VTYGCEAWTLTNRDEQHLRIFERRVLRKIFGPVQNEDGSWRIGMNYELNELIGNADIVRFTKSRTAWLGHVMRMDDKGAPKRILHHHISVMELGHLLTSSGLTYPEVSSKVCHDSFCQLGNSVSLP